MVIYLAAICLPPKMIVASTCKVRLKAPSSARAFAKADDLGDWREYRKIEEVPDLELNGGMSAQFWKDRNKTGSAIISARDQNYWSYTHYCFDSDGKLEGVGFEIRTPLGWGHRTEGSVHGGGLDSISEEFFSLKNGKTIVRPEGVGEAPAAFRPTLYLKMTELPFATLLTVSSHSKRH